MKVVQLKNKEPVEVEKPAKKKRKRKVPKQGGPPQIFTGREVKVFIDNAEGFPRFGIVDVVYRPVDTDKYTLVIVKHEY